MGLLDALRSAGDWLDKHVNDPINHGLDATLGTNFTNAPQSSNLFAFNAGNGSALLQAPVAGIEKVPYLNDAFTNTMGWLDMGRRGVEAALITAGHVDSDGNDLKGDLAVLTDTDVWRRAWDMTANEGGTNPANPVGITGGQVTTNAILGGPEVDPFAKDDAQVLQDGIHDTWYGQTMAATIDLGASLVSPPGLGLAGKAAKAARDSKQVHTLAEADALAGRLNDGKFAVEDADPASLFQRMKDATDNLVPFRQQATDSKVTRLVVGLRQFDGLHSTNDVLQKLRPMVESGSDAGLATIADLFTQANKIDDLAVRDRVRANVFLSAMGSSSARAALVRDNPLIARNLEGLTTNPVVNDVWHEYMTRSMNGEVVDFNATLRERMLTPGREAEAAAIHDEVLASIGRVHNATAYRDALKKAGAKFDPADSDALMTARSHAKNQVASIQEALKTERQNLLSAGEGLDEVGAAAAKGAAEQRIATLNEQLTQARADRDLLASTPSPRWVAEGEHAGELAAAEDAVKAAKTDQAWQEAFQRQHADAMKSEEQRLREVANDPRLDAAHRTLAQVLDITDDKSTALLGRGAAFEASALQRAQQFLRSKYGGEAYATYGAGNSVAVAYSVPTTLAARAMSPHARGNINVRDISLGANQLGDALARSNSITRSSVYSLDEIRAAKDELVKATEFERPNIIAKHQDIMLTRIAEHELKRMGIRGADGELLTGEDAMKHALDLVALTKSHWGAGRQWVSEAAENAAAKGGKLTTVTDDSGAFGIFNTAALRPHLADNVGFIDPKMFTRELRLHKDDIANSIRIYGHSTANALKFANRIWKQGALLRPGLFLRSFLDTGPRAVASMGAMATLHSTVLGAQHWLHNNPSTWMQVKLGRMTPAERAASLQSLGLTPKKIGGREWTLAAEPDELKRTLMAANRGHSVQGALFTDATTGYSRAKANEAAWQKYEPGAAGWDAAYASFARELAASPTVNKLVAMHHGNEAIDAEEAARRIMEDPAVRAEYRQVGEQLDLTFDQWVNHVTNDVINAFPTPEIFAAVKNGANAKVIDKMFPRSERFTVPGPELRVVKSEQVNAVKQVVDKSFEVLLDKPDMWLARVPVATHAYQAQVKAELAAMRKTRGGNYELSADELMQIHNRAKTSAVSYVRRTFFDTTRYTGAHAALAQVSPFFNAWDDALQSWARLLYENPKRATKLTAAYHAPYSIQGSTANALVVDENGDPIGRDNEAQSEYVVVPLTAFLNRKGVGAYRFRLDSLNSIAYGQTPWSPGVGPMVQVPAAVALQHAPEVAMALQETRDPFIKGLRDQTFLGGEIPSGQLDTVGASVLPSYIRNFYRDRFGANYAAATQTAFNAKVTEWNQQGGKPPTSKQLEQWWNEAEGAAKTAAYVHLVGQAGIGLSGKAAVDGQFYADQLHIIQGMTPEQRQGMDSSSFFNKMFPEAARLDWSIRKNETGITASVQAEKTYRSMESMLKSVPADAQWLVLGKDNLIDPEFSSYAYQQQSARGDRTTVSEKQAKEDAMAATGWRQYDMYSAQIDDAMQRMGRDPRTDTLAKQARSAAREYLMQDNPYFAKAVSQVSGKTAAWTVLVDQLSDPKTGALRNRSDMKTYQTYKQVRQEILDRLGMKSFDGKNAGPARAALADIGSTLAERDLGFQQMWTRWLSREVD